MPITRSFETLRSEGGLLPADLLQRINDPSSRLEGMRSEDYGLPSGERLTEAVTQSWNRLRKHWADFSSAREGMAAGEAGTGVTNDKWSLPLLRELGFGPLPAGAGREVNGHLFAISRFVGPVPVHLVGAGVDLDRRTSGVRGAATASPHGLLQDFLNREKASQWGIVCNGLRLRILRDNHALSRQSYFEADLEAMFAGEQFGEFSLLWYVAHHSRFAPRDGKGSDSCWLEQWTKLAEEQGTRALGKLRLGVQDALLALGQGFTSHPQNVALREALRSRTLSPSELHGQLLRVVYRLIFLFVAEDRSLEGQPLLHPPDDSDAAREARARYATHFSTARFRDMAARIRGSRHGDLWRQHQTIVLALSGQPEGAAARAALALPALGSFLWSPASTAALNQAHLANHDLLEGLRHLAFTMDGRQRRAVDYRSLGAEELGGVYEGLLALTPQVGSDGATFTFAEFAGNQRKTSGSYYTPDSLVQCLLDSALDPVVSQAIEGKKGEEAARAILDLKVCDPAVGSGHFLVGAAHRLARHLARVRAQAAGESEPSPRLYQQSLRDVIGRCLYGVDINPMAAELCRVSLWLEALEPGKPLSFLAHHIRAGNSILGGTPRLIAEGVPDAAFTVLSGDDPHVCGKLRSKNKGQRDTRTLLFVDQEEELSGNLALAALPFEVIPDSSVEALWEKERRFDEWEGSPERQSAVSLADLWCSAFFTIKARNGEGLPRGVTQQDLDHVVRHRELPDELRRVVNALKAQHAFFHWHLAFPEVFARGGFDCVFGNPPWERLKLQEEEFFAAPAPAIASAKNAAARKAMIGELRSQNPALWNEWEAALRNAEATSLFLRSSGRFPFGGVGDVNTYAVFTDLARQLVKPAGYASLIVPSGLVSGYTYRHFLKELLSTGSLVCFYGFENEELVFPAVTNKTKFGLITFSGGAVKTVAPTLASGLRAVSDISAPGRCYKLTHSELETLSPNSIALPAFRWARDADVCARIYSTAPVFVKDNGGVAADDAWKVELQTMFHMANDSSSFVEDSDVRALAPLPDGLWRLLPDGRRVLPLYEGKMLWNYDHRYGTYDGQTDKQANKGVLPRVSDTQHQDPTFQVTPRYWVASDTSPLTALAEDEWVFSWRDVGPAERTLVGAVVPRVAFGHTAPFLTCRPPGRRVAALVAMLSSLLVDYVARQRSSRLSFFVVEQLAVLPPFKFEEECLWAPGNVLDWIVPRVLELSYTSHDLAPFAKALGYEGPPCLWDPQRRVTLQAELDAAVFLLYGLDRQSVRWVLDSFSVLKKYEERDLGYFRTATEVIGRYDALSAAVADRTSYVSPVSLLLRSTEEASGEGTSVAGSADSTPRLQSTGRGAEAVADGLLVADLPRSFPQQVFTLRLSAAASSRLCLVQPTVGAVVAAGEHIVLTHPGLKLDGRTVPAAIGILRVDPRRDAATDEEYVVVSVKTDQSGVAQVKLRPEEWANLRTVGRVLEN